MKLKWLLSVAALVASSLVLGGAESRAGNVTLPTSLAAANGNSFVVGDKSFNILNATPAGTQSPSLANIQVIPETPGLGGTIVPPFGFGLSGPIVAAFAADGTIQTSDLALTYTVTSPVGEPTVALNLSGTGTAVGAGSTISIAETIVNNANGQVIGTGTLVGSGALSITLAQAATSITVTMDVLATSGPTIGSVANYAVITETFSQAQAVPEPASIAMLGLGLVGLGGVLLRRRLGAV